MKTSMCPWLFVDVGHSELLNTGLGLKLVFNVTARFAFIAVLSVGLAQSRSCSCSCFLFNGHHHTKQRNYRVCALV